MRFLVSFFILFFTSLCAIEKDQAEYQLLNQIALQAGADKSSAFHNYTEIYAQYFAKFRNEPIKFMEIGIYKGSSVKLWEQYFPNAELHFIDITTKYIEYYSQRSHYHFVDQSDRKALQTLAQNILGGGFDVILDDGGHTMDGQITSFQVLFPFVKSGGMYIIEDLHTSYWRSFGGKGTQQHPKAGQGTTVGYLQNLIDDLNYTGAVTGCADDNKVPPALQKTLNYFQDQIYSMHFYDSVCIIIKK